MRLHNTLRGDVEELVPREPGRVAMYVCGPTVYDHPHFGHARAAVMPDVLRRYLEWLGFDVLHVRNITDIDDKIIARAASENRMAAAVAEDYTRSYDEALRRLRVLPPHVVPRATGHLLEMQALIGELLDRGHAYRGDDGDVWFAVRTHPGYGKLSGHDLDDLRAGARIQPGEGKRDPLDFALWKSAKPDEPSWPSPWGEGRPGWHIECSAMAGKYLGTDFDIHAGGLDLVFPHHENELAQSEAATGAPFARYWVHNGLLAMGGEKMSKSLGNVIGLSEALDRYGADVVRFFYLAAHYRSPVELAEDRLTEAAAALERWRSFIRATAGEQALEGVAPEVKQARERFRAAMDDDLHTPAAHAALFDLVATGHAHLEAGRRAEAAAVRPTLLELAGVLGYDLRDDEDEAGELVGPLVAELLALREQARADKDFATADRLRERLTALGIVVEDSADGPRWYLDRSARP